MPTVKIDNDQVQLTDTQRLFGSNEPLSCLVVDTDRCRAVVSFQGAQLLSFQPKGQGQGQGKGEDKGEDKGESDWLWLSPLANFVAGRAIRGGIPLCLPWFGRHRSDVSLPKHGFVRLRDWRFAAVQSGPQHLRLGFDYHSTEADLALFPWRFRARIDYTLSESIDMLLRVDNLSDTPMPLSFAMHSYFAVEDLSVTRIGGIHGAQFLDNTCGLGQGYQHQPLQFGGEVDKVFPGLGGEQGLTDGRRSRLIAGHNCDTAIIWNPGSDALADVGQHYRDFICLERGMAFDDALEVAPSRAFQAMMTIRAAPG